MAIRPILRLGDSRLLRPADPLTLPADPQTRRLAADMIDTMIDADGAGLAAPQVGHSVRLIVFRVPPERIADDPDAATLAPALLCNPEFTPEGNAREDGLEGCLSIPGLRGVVRRWRTIRYRGRSLDGTAVEGRADGFHARVIQHECDHLNGIVFLQHIDDFHRLGYRREIEARLAGRKDIRLAGAGNIP